MVTFNLAVAYGDKGVIFNGTFTVGVFSSSRPFVISTELLGVDAVRLKSYQSPRSDILHSERKFQSLETAFAKSRTVVVEEARL